MENQIITNAFLSGQDSLLSRKEVADLLQISLVTLHNHKVNGILIPTYKVGRKPLYLMSEVLKQIQLLNKNL